MRTSSGVLMLCASPAAGTVMDTVIALMALMNKTVLLLLVQTLNSYVLKKIVALKSQSFVIATVTALMAQMKRLHAVSISVTCVLVLSWLGTLPEHLVNMRLISE